MWELFTKLQIAPLRGAKKLALFLALAKFPFRLQSCFPTIVIFFLLNYLLRELRQKHVRLLREKKEMQHTVQSVTY